MDDQIANLAADIAALRAAQEAGGTTVAEMFYFLTLPLMTLIHAGFLFYEMGASRAGNALASGTKNLLAFAAIIPGFYVAGWWVYWAFPTGLDFSAGPAGLSGWDYAWTAADPLGGVMGPNLGDSATGVFWAAFTLFAVTTASILSGSVLERIRTVPFVLLAMVLGCFVWILAAAWGWHADGWLVTRFGFHDFGASGVVHAVAGFFTLGVLLNLGPRIGKYAADGTPNDLPGHSMPMAVAGVMLIITGFWGFLMACAIFPGQAWSWTETTYASIYGTPVTLSALGFNILLAVSGGIIGAWITARGPFWMVSGGLGGIIACAAGMDLWHPALAFLIAFAGAAAMGPVARRIERAGIDDAVGAVTVHGVLGIWGLMAVGLFASGYPALATPDAVVTGLVGQAVGAAVMAALGFVPGYLGSLAFKRAAVLRVPEAAERAGLGRTGRQTIGSLRQVGGATRIPAE